MRVPSDSPLAHTWPLTQPDRAELALAQLIEPFDQATLEALVELIHANQNARLVVQAIRRVAPLASALIDDALLTALQAPQAIVRLEALEACANRTIPALAEWLIYIVHNDPSWPTRRAAIRLLAQHPEPLRLHVLHAASDPHWRVRHALLAILEHWPTQPTWNLDEWPSRVRARVAGVALALAHRRNEPCTLTDVSLNERERPPYFDWDPAVMAYKLESMNADHRAAWIAQMPELLAHDDDRVRRVALRTLRERGDATWWAECVKQLDEPRTGAGEFVRELFAHLDLDDRHDVREHLQSLAELSHAQRRWLEQGEMLLARAPTPPPLSPDHPHERAKRLTRELAQALLAIPMQETSWHVLHQACKLLKVPVWTIAPDVDKPSPPIPNMLPTLSTVRGPLVQPRVLGPNNWHVTPLGVSGHYGLPVQGFVTALEIGVNLYFWEPNYTTLTGFSQQLSPGIRRDLYFVAGTFEATAKGIRRDCERALAMLKLERLPLFLLFWTRSWDRLSDEIRVEIDQLRDEGKAEVVSLSTHDRALAVEAMQAGWNPVMVRHSAAHRNAETLIFPYATTRGTSLITFNNTCYGRLLKPSGLSPVPSAADCYRYALEQPNVSACWTAPTTVEQLDANLQALLDPVLPEDRRAALLAHGAHVYAEDSRFTRWIRTR